MEIIHLNRQQYGIEIRLYNTDGDEISIPWQLVIDLTLEDNLFAWQVGGYLTYKSMDDMLERSPGTKSDIKQDPNLAQTQKILLVQPPYRFRNDGRDFLSIHIKPIHEDRQDNIVKDSLQDELWSISKTFVIYDKEDLPDVSPPEKYRKLYFYDAAYQVLTETRLQWSSATSKLNPKGVSTSAYRVTDEARRMPTGLMIKDILLNCGYEVDDEYFDKGQTEFFFACHGNMRAWDAIEYLLSNHLSEHNNDACIFSRNRHTKKFRLIPISKYLEQAGKHADAPGKWQIENITLSSSVPFTGIPKFKTPIPPVQTKDRAFFTTIVDQYTYTDASPILTADILTPRIINTHDHAKKAFKMDTTFSTMPKIMEQLSEVYIRPNLLSVNGAHPMLLSNKPKNTLTNCKQVYSIYSDKSAIMKHGLGVLTQFAFFIIGELELDMPGQTYRQSGLFFGLDRLQYSESFFDNKLYGQWFTSKVTHQLSRDSYTQNVIGVKTHSYDAGRFSNTSP